MPFNVDIGHEKDLVGHKAHPPPISERHWACFGGCDSLKFPSIQIKGELGWVLPLVSHALWGETQPLLKLPAAPTPNSLDLQPALIKGNETISPITTCPWTLAKTLGIDLESYGCALGCVNISQQSQARSPTQPRETGLPDPRCSSRWPLPPPQWQGLPGAKRSQPRLSLLPCHLTLSSVRQTHRVPSRPRPVFFFCLYLVFFFFFLVEKSMENNPDF